MREFIPHLRLGRLVVAGVIASTVAVPGSPASATAAGMSTWTAGSGRSECVQVATTTVRCVHNYSSISKLGTETCVFAGLNVGVSSCHAELVEVTTSGPGRVATEGGAVCDTVVLNETEFRITTPYGYYVLLVDVVNNEVSSKVAGRKVTTAGLIVADMAGQFTGGCGIAGYLGTFSGRFNLTAPL